MGTFLDFAIPNPPESLMTLLHRFAAAVAFAFALGVQAEERPLATVTALDLDRYLGTWYEIARYPNFFERMCVRDITADYARNADGTIKVVNACRKDDGGMTSAQGVARVVVPPAKLQVRFAPDWLAFLPFLWGDYWVIELAPDYGYVVVGEPGRGYLWILARSPQMPESTLADIVARLPALGYDPAKLIRVPPPAP